MFKLDNHVLVHILYWFGLVMAAFGFFTEISQRIIYLSSDFYLQLAMVSFLPSIALSRIVSSECCKK
jgi:hypothetical protein